MFIAFHSRTLLLKTILLFLCIGSVYFFSYTAFAQSATAAPEINSVMNEDEWYPQVMGPFTWEIPPDVTAVAVEVATSTNHEPMFVYEPPINEFTIDPEEITEGVHYLSVQFKDANGWGDIAYYKIQIDRTPPHELYLNIVDGSEKDSMLIFETTDALSGIVGYVVSIGNAEPVYVSSEQSKNGYVLSDMDIGKYPIRVTAYDRAGNHYTNSFPLFVTDYIEKDEQLVLGLFTSAEALMLALLAVTLCASGLSLYTHRYHIHRSQKLRTEVYEVQEQLEKIFTALRNEIHEQIRSIRSRSRISKKEAEVVKNLDKALEVSNTLVEKEMLDVKKMLK